MKRIEGILARLLVIALTILLMLLLAEAAANHYLWNIATVDEFNLLASINQIKDRYGDEFFTNYRSPEGVAHRFTPHHFLGHWPTPNLNNGRNQHNALGFRGPEVSIQKAEDIYRIVALGGSTTYSTAVDDYRLSYPYLLGEYLRENGFERAEVINAGVNGYSSYHNLINLMFRVLPLQPDLVIIYQGLNDVDARLVHPPEKYLGDNSGYIRPFISPTIMPEIWEYSTALRILAIRWGLTSPHTEISRHRHLPAVSNYRDRFLQQWTAGAYPSGFFADVSAMDMLMNNPPIHFERNLLNMIAVTNRHEIESLLVTFVYTNKIRHPMNSSDEYIFALDQHNDVTRRIAAATDTPIFDMAAVFPDDPALFSDGRHMTREGNLARAQLIGDFVIRNFLQS